MCSRLTRSAARSGCVPWLEVRRRVRRSSRRIRPAVRVISRGVGARVLIEVWDADAGRPFLTSLAEGGEPALTNEGGLGLNARNARPFPVLHPGTDAA